MSDRRPDYLRFLADLDLDSQASPWEQLARSEGRRTGDTVQVFPVPAVNADGSTTCRFLVHGIRHVASTDGLDSISEGDEVRLVDEPGNPVNSDAVQVCDEHGACLGYVPDLLLDHLRAIQGAGPVRVLVEHVNGPEAPYHLRLLARLDGIVPDGYRPMTGSAWATFDDGLDRTRNGG